MSELNVDAYGYSERPLSEVTLDAVRRGEVSIDDVRIHPNTLRHQASVAAAHGNPNLSENLLRAAELTSIPDEEVMAIYEALRPYRSTASNLFELADSLDSRGAPLVAELVREASRTYQRRGLAKPE